MNALVDQRELSIDILRNKRSERGKSQRLVAEGLAKYSSAMAVEGALWRYQRNSQRRSVERDHACLLRKIRMTCDHLAIRSVQWSYTLAYHPCVGNGSMLCDS